MSTPVDRLTSFTHDGLIFDVVDAGPVDGDVVVLLHGFPERASSWEQVAARLHAQGYRTLAPDQRGYSPGARPKGRRAYRIELLVADVAALVELAGGRAHVVGHDWGAIVAWSFAIARPELVRTLTALSVPHPASFLHAMTRTTQGLKSWYMAAFQIPAVPELLAGWRGGPVERWMRAGGMDDAAVERFQRDIVGYGALPGGLAWYRAMPFMDRGGDPRVTVPTTMIWSDGDLYIGRAAVEGAARFMDAPYELVVLPGVSHWIPTEAPEPAADAILARLESPA
ncbi:alpha/beta fold hydrolase [Aeromicrobium sp.]|uniref:alpha/beta fold hydrolase n=1 Tax=Aeromicrobium sp. TaxID=1871063 RepID=UPI0025C22F8B|nr:alpha/beta fold hydrolase [Aeromicrobium sp.]MCK5891532.1 alpha/beta fold hydrolase [Aeromicrobium sp.]